MAPAQPYPPSVKVKLPDLFLRKTGAPAHFFLTQCQAYARLQPFPSEEFQIEWTLQLMGGEASAWRDEQHALLTVPHPPRYLTDWDDFEDHFKARWLDPHEEEKVIDQIQ